MKEVKLEAHAVLESFSVYFRDTEEIGKRQVYVKIGLFSDKGAKLTDYELKSNKAFSNDIELKLTEEQEAMITALAESLEDGATNQLNTIQR